MIARTPQTGPAYSRKFKAALGEGRRHFRVALHPGMIEDAGSGLLSALSNSPAVTHCDTQRSAFQTAQITGGGVGKALVEER